MKVINKFSIIDLRNNPDAGHGFFNFFLSGIV
jgi:hypothetical protein